MKVEQYQNPNVIENVKQGCKPEEAKGTLSFKDAVKVEKEDLVNFKSINVKDATYFNPTKEEQKTAIEEIEEASSMDATERKNQMAVLSNTTSEEDFARMQEEGFSLDSTTSNTIVTVTDKIKAELAKAGVDISAFGEELTAEQIEKIAGSPELARQLSQAFCQADLPLTEENIRDTVEVLGMSGSLSVPSDGAVKYLLDNGLEPTIENLYMAEYSGSSSYRPAPSIDMTSFLPQIQAMIQTAGLEVNEKTLQTSQWMLENDISLTPQSISYAMALKEMQFPIGQELLVDNVATAVKEGRRPKDAMLIEGYSLEEQAKRTMDIVNAATDEDVAYVIEHGMEFTIESLKRAQNNRDNGLGEMEFNSSGMEAANWETNAKAVNGNESSNKMSGEQINSDEHVPDDHDREYTRDGLNLITAKRQLEELRLVMTAQANYALLKQGISIETEPLAALVDHLKELENSYYHHLLEADGVDASEENVTLFKEITKQVTEIKTVPAYVLGMKEEDVSTITGVHKAGTALKDSFEKANERYETLMTSPRADLGDSIQKAFRNVDDILADMQLENTEENRRAVRILGYNSLEITSASVTEMKAADEKVQRVFKNLTPSVVVEMIKRGINPLQMDFAGINDVAEKIKSESVAGEETQKYSEYLWKLEQNHAISEEERSTYIGIYRLIRQVEKTDGAAIGALVNQGAELTMKNLLTAVRSERRSGKMQYAVNDDFGGMERTSTSNSSITEQIASAYQAETSYQNNCLKDVLDSVTPEKMRKLMEQAPDWENMTPEQLKNALEETTTDEKQTDIAYAREQLKQLEQAANVTKDIYQVLEKYDIPNTMANVLAMQNLVKDRNQMFRKIFGSGVKDADEKPGMEDLEEIKEELLKEFGEAVKEPADMAIAQEKLGELAENVMKTMINEEDITSLDVREMRLLSAQLSISSMFAKEEQYCVPVLVNDEMMNVSVKIVRGVDKKGVVDIMMESELRGKIAATFQAKENGISGLIATDNKETKELFEQKIGELDTISDIHCAYIKDLDLNHFSMGMYGVEAKAVESEDKESENYKVQTSRLYHIAESFLKNIKEVL